MIYFVQARGTLHIKIGYALDSPENRIAVLQTGCPLELVLLATLNGDQSVERDIHAHFAADRGVGEWFILTPEMLRFIIEARALELQDDIGGDEAPIDVVCGAALVLGGFWESMS